MLGGLGGFWQVGLALWAEFAGCVGCFAGLVAGFRVAEITVLQAGCLDPLVGLVLGLVHVLIIKDTTETTLSNHQKQSILWMDWAAPSSHTKSLTASNYKATKRWSRMPGSHQELR